MTMQAATSFQKLHRNLLVHRNLCQIAPNWNEVVSARLIKYANQFETHCCRGSFWLSGSPRCVILKRAASTGAVAASELKYLQNGKRQKVQAMECLISARPSRKKYAFCQGGTLCKGSHANCLWKERERERERERVRE